MKVTVLLTNEHASVKSLFFKYKNAGARDQFRKQQLFGEIRHEIRLHLEMATKIFYPALAGTPSSVAGQFASSADQEYVSIQELLDSMNIRDTDFDTKMDQLIEAMTRHIEMEEEEVFDEARKVFPEHRLEELGLEIASWQKILAYQAA